MVQIFIYVLCFRCKLWKFCISKADNHQQQQQQTLQKGCFAIKGPFESWIWIYQGEEIVFQLSIVATTVLARVKFGFEQLQMQNFSTIKLPHKIMMLFEF